MGDPKNHHLVPECYLKEFATESKKLLQVYDKKLKKKSKPKTPAQVGYEIDAFMIRSEETLLINRIVDRYEIEKESFKRLENNYPKILSKIKSVIGGKLYLSETESEDFLELLLSIRRRSLDFRNLFLDKKALAEYVDKRVEEMMPQIQEAANIAGEGENLEITLKERIRNVLESDEKLYDGYLMQLKDTDILKGVVKQLKSLKWIIASAPINSHFITSDNPGFSINKSNAISSFGGFGEAFTFVFPITPLHALVIVDKYKDDDYTYKKALHFQNFESKLVISINKTTLATAREKIFANSYSSIEASLI